MPMRRLVDSRYTRAGAVIHVAVLVCCHVGRLQYVEISRDGSLGHAKVAYIPEIP